MFYNFKKMLWKAELQEVKGIKDVSGILFTLEQDFLHTTTDTNLFDLEDHKTVSIG